MEEEERLGKTREGINEGGGMEGGSSSSEDEKAAERALLSAVRPSPSQPHIKRSAQSTDPFRAEWNLRVCATPPPPPHLRLHHLALTAPRAAL